MESWDIKTLHLTQDIGGQLEVYVSEFTPLPEDKISYTWKNGSHTMEMPPYALANIEKIRANLLNYINEYSYKYLEDLITLDELLRSTIRVALDYSKLRHVSCSLLTLNLG
jgi:hypothetical protein